MNHQRTHSRQVSVRRRPRPSGQVWFTRGRRFPLLFSRIGPVTVSICSVILISLMAVLYLSQQGQVVATNQQIQALRNRQAVLQRQNDDLTNTIATEQSPDYIVAFAKKMGLVPVTSQNTQIITSQQVQDNRNQTNQP